MELEPIDERLLDHLKVEFRDHGRRAVDFLLTAQSLLGAEFDEVLAPRLAESVAYCLREAMKTIPSSQDVGGGVQWKSASRSVTDARRRYQTARGIPGQDETGALRALLEAIDDLEVVHAQEGIHERRLIAIMVARTGVAPVASGTGPIRVYQDVITELDAALHGSASSDCVRDLWNRSVAILRRLFSPPDLRREELDLLADTSPVFEIHVTELLPLIAGPNHLRYFLSRIPSTEWLDALLDTDLLDPPSENAPWPAFFPIERLAAEHGQALADWLRRLYARHPHNAVQAFYLADAGLSAGPVAVEFVLACLRAYPEELSILGVRAVEKLDGTSDLVEAFADVLFNAGPWKRSSYMDPVVERFVRGVTEGNARNRLKLLCWKLRSVEDGEGSRNWMKYEQGGSIADLPDAHRDDRFAVLLHSLAQVIRSSSEWVRVVEALEIVDSLPEDIRNRARALVLACNPDHPISEIVDEFTHAIATRDPTGDDLPLVDRVAVNAGSARHFISIGLALGDAPSVAAVAEGLNTNTIPRQWLRSFLWACLLPGEAIGAWASAVAVMSGAYGRAGRESLQKRHSTEFGYGQSPMSIEDLGSLAPIDAARQISTWRPDPSQPMVGARVLARTLEAAINARPAEWLASPVAIATQLKQPTYISHYLSGVAGAIKTGVVPPIAAVLDVVALVRAQPWVPDPIGRDGFDYDQNWRGSEQAAVDVVKSLAGSDVGFSGRDDEVWGFLESKVRDRGELSGLVSGARDPLDSAINRPCTRALEAVFSLLAHEFRSEGKVRDAGLALMQEALHLEGLDGAEHRAIIATRLGFLRHVAPQWVEFHAPLLFGPDAPPGLAQVTTDLALKWSRPNRWLLENFRALVRDAALRDVENSVDHVLIAMLWNVPGYGVQDNIAFLRQAPTQLSRAGEMLGRLLRHDDVTAAFVTHGVQFWDAAIATKDPSALAGFGRLAEVAQLNDEIWAARTWATLRFTGGSIDWSHKVAERAASLAPSTTTLAILNGLVRGLSDEWDRRRSVERAVDLIGRADDLKATPEFELLRTTLLERGAL